MSDVKLKRRNFWDYFFSQNRMPLFFFTGMIFAWVLFIFYSMIQGDAYYKILFFGCGDDTFMDFYNSCRDAAQGMNCYIERKVIYPPMANLFYQFCNRFLTNRYLHTSIFERMTFAEDPSNLMIFFIYTALSCGAIALIYDKVLKGSSRHKAFTILFLFMNYPFVYLIERGNILVLAYVGMLLFVFFYDYDCKFVREFACLCLAFAAAIKMYPAVLGLLLVIDKRYKQAIRTAIYGVLMFVLPFGAYHWMEGFNYWVTNIKNFSGVHAFSPNFAGVTSARNAIYVLKYMITGNYGFKGAVDIVISGILFVLCVAALFILKEKHQKFIAMFLLMDLLPGAGGAYTFVFLIIPLIYLMNEAKVRILDYLYFFLILSTFVPYPLPLKFRIKYLSVNNGMLGMVVLAFLALIIVDIAITIYKSDWAKKFKKNNKNGKNNKNNKASARVASAIIAICIAGSIAGFTDSRVVLADEVPASATVVIDEVTYTIRQTPEGEIPAGFAPSSIVYNDAAIPVLTKDVGLGGRWGKIVLVDLDDGSGFKFYRFNTALESLEPYVYVEHEGLLFIAVPAKVVTFTKDMDFYEIAVEVVNGEEFDIAVYNYTSAANAEDTGDDHSVADDKLICLVDPYGNVGLYSYDLVDGQVANIVLFRNLDFYPTPYPASIGNHTLAKKLNVSAEIITLVCVVVVFVPLFVGVMAYLYVNYRKGEKKQH